jgi:hypothetical protein
MKHCLYLLICLPVCEFANTLSDFKEYLTLAVDGIVPHYITHFPASTHAAASDNHRLLTFPVRVFLCSMFLTVHIEHHICTEDKDKVKVNLSINP